MLVVDDGPGHILVSPESGDFRDPSPTCFDPREPFSTSFGTRPFRGDDTGSARYCSRHQGCSSCLVAFQATRRSVKEPVCRSLPFDTGGGSVARSLLMQRADMSCASLWHLSASASARVLHF